MKLSSILTTVATLQAALVVHHVDAAEGLLSDEIMTTMETSHHMVRTSSSSSSSSSSRSTSQRHRELILDRLRRQDFCIKDANGRRQNVRLFRPLFVNGRRQDNVVQRGKCNVCPCDSTRNFVCFESLNLCTCQKGYRINALNDACVDIDECAESASPGAFPVCRKRTCTNTPGNFTCDACPCSGPYETCNSATNTCTCQPGFAPDSVFGESRDIDECRVNPTGACPSNTTRCKNTVGSYDCTPCPVGYEYNAFDTCVDIDECSRQTNATSLCPLSTTRCKNTIGSFNCTKCAAGYEYNASSVCVDVDECSRNATLCGLGFTCSNTVGSYTCNACPCANCNGLANSTTCTCAPGFFRRYNATSNTTNTSIPVVVPLNTSSSTICADIDECAANRSICGVNQTCTNIAGGYTCTNTMGGGGNGGGGIITTIITTILCFPFFFLCL